MITIARRHQLKGNDQNMMELDLFISHAHLKLNIQFFNLQKAIENVASFETLQLISLIVLPDYLVKISRQFYHLTTHDFEEDPTEEFHDYVQTIWNLS